MPASQHAILDQLRWSLQALAVPAETQLRLFPDFVAKADELANDFDNWCKVVLESYETDLTVAQVSALKAIDRRLAAMSRSGPEYDESLWTDAGLRDSARWQEVRVLAATALHELRWSIEPPPATSKRGIAYVRGV